MPDRALAQRTGTGGCAGTGEVRAQIAKYKDELHREVKDHPMRTIAMAAGAGYVIGGGLFSRLTGRIIGTGLRLALRMAVVPLVAETIVAVLHSAPARGSRPPRDAHG